jgi:hypothetical protein
VNVEIVNRDAHMSYISWSNRSVRDRRAGMIGPLVERMMPWCFVHDGMGSGATDCIAATSYSGD